MNAKRRISTKGLSHEEWLEARRQGIGGSDVAAICGLSPWKDPLVVWMEKTGWMEGTESTEAMYWGTLLEDVVRKEFMERTGLKVRRIHAMLEHPHIPYLLANVDGIVTDGKGEQGIFEAKTTSAYNKGDWEKGALPEAYLLQMQHYLMVTGLSYAHVAVLIGGNEFHQVRIERDEELLDLLLPLERDFWENHVMKDKAPDPTAQSCQLLSKLYPGGKPETLILPEDTLELVKRFESFQEQEKEAKAFKEEAANQLKILMGDHELAKVDGYTLSWKSVTLERFDTKAFKAAHSDLAAAFLQESITRRFSVKSK